MLDFAAELQAEGLLLGVNSLGSAAKRLAKRDNVETLAMLRAGGVDPVQLRQAVLADQIDP